MTCESDQSTAHLTYFAGTDPEIVDDDDDVIWAGTRGIGDG